MSNRIGLLATLLAIPLFALLSGNKIASTMESKWRAALQKQFPEITTRQLDVMPLQRYCTEIPESSELRVCQWFPTVHLLRRGAILAALLGLGLVAAIYTMSRLSRGNRRRLLILFKPGLYLTIVLLAGLLLIHAGLLLGTISLGQIASLGHILVFGMFLVRALGLGSTFGLVLLIRAMIFMLHKPKTVVFGRPLSPEGHPCIWKYAKDLAAQLGALAPDNIVVGLDANFFVIEGVVRTLAGNVTGRTLYLSLPLSHIFREGEFRSIMGHELGHFKGDDTAFSQQFYPIYRGVGEALASLDQSAVGSTASIVLMPILSVLSYFYTSFATAEKEIGRERELAADRVGLAVSSARDTASALVKAHAFGSYWESALQRMRETLNQGDTVTNVSRLFCALVSDVANPSALLGLDDECLAHPMDTHPPLHERLEAIRVTLPEVEEAILTTAPVENAVRLIDRYEDLETELTKAEQEWMVKHGEVRLNAQIQCPACGRANPVTADVCPCGLNFRRYGM